jgi:carbamoyl-phosphate synthase small subunit
MTEAYMVVEGERVIEGRTRAPGRTRGEAVFTTAYTGYEESLTDPSYAEQVLTFSYPLIGNYGVRSERFESDRVQPRAAIARELTDDVAAWLAEEDVPAVDRLDTRDLVTAIREEGVMRCGIAAGPEASPEAALEELDRCEPMSAHTDIGATVSVAESRTLNPEGTGPHVALLDCGAKRSILDSLLERDTVVTVLPYDATPADVSATDPDVLFVSNGPGDPETYDAAKELIEAFAGDLAIAGICLGQQIVASALGGSTEKMRFGHRGINQPVRDLQSGRVVMTTQNHGYSVTDSGALDVTQINVNDDTAEGLASADLPVLTRQYHPEAHPGPHDSLSFFDDVLAMSPGKTIPTAD